MGLGEKSAPRVEEEAYRSSPTPSTRIPAETTKSIPDIRHGVLLHSVLLHSVLIHSVLLHSVLFIHFLYLGCVQDEPHVSCLVKQI